MSDFEGKNVVELSVSVIDSFPDHPYLVTDDADMKSLKKSISERGVINPAIVRQKSDGRYEMISGHRRRYACASIGQKLLPCIVVDVDDDTATLMMVEANYNRSKLLPSEKAKAYSMQYEAMKHQGQSSGVDVGEGLRSDEILARKTGESRSQIQRYLKIVKLIPELIMLVDKGKLALRPAVALSELTYDDQKHILKCYEQYGIVPTETQVCELSSKLFALDYDDVVKVLLKNHNEQSGKIYFDVKDIACFFRKGASKDYMKRSIIELLEANSY